MRRADPDQPLARVLVIEPSPTLRLVIASLLRRWGFVVDHDGVADGAYALMVAAPSAGDPALDGLRQSMRAAGVPWLAVLPADGAGMAADADGWVQKPIAAEALHDAVRLCLDRRSRRRRPDGLDIDAIAALWGSTEDATFRRVAGVFIQEMAERLTTIAAALASMDRDSLTIDAHSVGSAAANVGCAALSRAARQLESAVASAMPSRIVTLVTDLQACAARDLAALQVLVAGG